MINAVNEAINRKLASISFTTIINGIVESISPLQIRINSRIVIGPDFIEPKSLGINDYSPGQTLPLIVGEKIQMVRYNNGQRFYVLGKSVSSSEVDYSALQNKPKLNTNNATAQAVNSSEEINGTIKLHKISKTGKYSDLVNIPKNKYSIRGEYASADRYIYLGKLKFASVRENCVITLYSGNGWNGHGWQNAETKIIIKRAADDWKNNHAGVYVERYNDNDVAVASDAVYSKTMAFVVYNSSDNSFDVYVYLPWEYWAGYYEINGDFSSWEHKGTQSSAEPTGVLARALYRDVVYKDYVDTNFLQFEVIEEF